jgi:hypothetical protein
MPLELMRDEMCRQIRLRSGSAETLLAYRVAWDDAVSNSGKPLPCPACFISGDISRLKPISEKDGIAVVRCKSCRATFEYESPETRWDDTDGSAY